jgi:3-phytase
MIGVVPNGYNGRRPDLQEIAMPRLALVTLILLPLGVVSLLPVAPAPPAPPVPTVVLTNRAADDQDDLCVWVHPSDAAQSTVITSDKHANKLFVYDLAGRVIQTVDLKYPGNIDIRSGFSLAGAKVDVAVVNLRADKKLAVFRVDSDSRKLTRVDDRAIATGENYGGCLYRSAKSGKLFAVVTSYSGAVTQIELADDGTGKVRGKTVRTWKVGGVCEGAVGDDERGQVFISEESRGVWEIGGEPDDPTPGGLVIKVGENGLHGDVEGLAIFPTAKGKGYLIVSDQGKNTFRVYQRGGKHEYVGAFRVKGAVDTDGIEVVAAKLGPAFPNGLFACHTAAKSPCPVLLTSWDAIAKTFDPPLEGLRAK